MQKLNADAAELRSEDILAKNIDQIRSLFPEAFTQAGIDFDVLKQLLGGPADAREEKYGLNWNGKRRARQLSLTQSNGTLRPMRNESLEWETTQNLLIEGDNLEVLKLLQKSYAGTVKLIYIDPPYNTGKDFVYPDKFQEGIRNYLELTGQHDQGRKLSSNTESSGRFHTDWLNMMYPRLKLARNLLKHDGLICMSMDDHEVATLRLICDEIFGEESFIGTLTWITTTQPDNIGRARFGLQQNIEYVLMYSKCSRLELPPFVLEVKTDAPKYPHVGKFGPCRFEIIERAFEGAYARPTMRFNILGQPPRDGKQWQIGEQQARDLEARGRVEIVDGIVKRAVYPEDESDDAAGFYPFWAHLKDVETSQSGKAELTELLGPGHGVDTVKPKSLIRKLLGHLPADSVVLDFFAGSGTTANAVFEANAADNGKRRCILVQLPLPLDINESRQRSSAEFCDSIGKPRTLAEITKERLRRATAEVKADNATSAGLAGFRAFKLEESNIRVWNPNSADIEQTLFANQDHLVVGRTEEDILYELLLKLGLDLCVPILQRSASGKTIYSVGEGSLLACLDMDIRREEIEEVSRAILEWHVELKPVAESMCVFRDSAFEDDVAKTNMAAILSQHGIKNVRSL